MANAARWSSAMFRAFRPPRWTRTTYSDSTTTSGTVSEKYIGPYRQRQPARANQYKPVEQPKLLLREYIQQCLYDQHQGYFQRNTGFSALSRTAGTAKQFAQPGLHDRAANVSEDHGKERGGAFGTTIGTLASPIEFKELWGRSEYEYHLKTIYETANTAWYTPVELFQPYYSHAMARRLVDVYNQSTQDTPLIIVEIGCGNGTLSRGILDYLQTHEPEIYKQTAYVLVEISKSQCDMLRTRLSKYVEEHKAFVIQKSILDLSKDDLIQVVQDKLPGLWDSQVHVVLTEVLDNMPHDCVYYDKRENDFLQMHVTLDSLEIAKQEGRLTVSSTDPLAAALYSLGSDHESQNVIRPKVEFTSLQDDLIKRTLSVWDMNKQQRGAETVFSWLKAIQDHFFVSSEESMYQFIPTATVSMLEVLARVFGPGYNMTCVDFTMLPKTAPGINGPLIQRTTPQGNTLSYGSLENAPMYQCDIMFPTNFYSFQEAFHRIRLAHSVTGGVVDIKQVLKQSQVSTSREFLQKYADYEHTETKSGYNPMLEDFGNQSFLLVPPMTEKD